MEKSLLLVGVLLIYLTGTFSVFTTILQSHHQTIFQLKVQAQEKDDTDRLFFSQRDFQALSWIEKNREFEWNGEMYDVNRIEQIENGFLIYCENDGFEKFLVTILKSLKKDMEGSANNLVIQPQFVQAFFEYSFTNIYLKAGSENLFYLTFFKSIELSIPSPPPKAKILSF